MTLNAKIKTHSISDLFYTSWEELTTDKMAQLIDLRHKLQQAKNEEMWGSAGFLTISILRLLRKNKDLVAKINEAQAVDCINDLKFIHKPWYHFPPGTNFLFKAPDEKMHDLSFNQFVFADAAFTKFCVLDHQAQTTGVDNSIAINRTINHLISILYTPAQYFDEKKIHEIACTVDQKMNQEEKAVVLHTYANVREYIVNERCPNLFPSGQSTTGDSIIPVYTGKMWLNLRYDLSETPSFPGLHMAKKAWLYDALDLLEKKALEATKKPATV